MDASQAVKARAYIGTKNQRDTGVERQKALTRKHDDDTRGRRGALHQCSEDGAEGDSQQWRVHVFHEVDEWLVGLQRLGAIAHQLHAIENKPQPHDHSAVVAHTLFFQEKGHRKPDADEQQGILGNLEGDDLGRHGRADVGSHNDADGLGKVHQPGGDEANDQYRGHRGRLDDGGHRGTCGCTREAIGGQFREDFPQAITRDELQSHRHALHAEEKQGKPSQ